MDGSEQPLVVAGWDESSWMYGNVEGDDW